jgi:hypothetical protein
LVVILSGAKEAMTAHGLLRFAQDDNVAQDDKAAQDDDVASIGILLAFCESHWSYDCSSGLSDRLNSRLRAPRK